MFSINFVTTNTCAADGVREIERTTQIDISNDPERMFQMLVFLHKLVDFDENAQVAQSMSKMFIGLTVEYRKWFCEQTLLPRSAAVKPLSVEELAPFIGKALAGRMLATTKTSKTRMSAEAFASWYIEELKKPEPGKGFSSPPGHGRRNRQHRGNRQTQ